MRQAYSFYIYRGATGSPHKKKNKTKQNKTKKQAVDTEQKIKFSIKDLFSKCEQIHRKLWIWSHLLKKSLMENFIFCAVYFPW